jgi:hypothetical protein
MPILKMLGRHTLSAFSQTLNYINQSQKQKGEPVLHNLRSSAENSMALVDEFLTNEAYRKVTSNRVYCYHSILSVSDLDQKAATPEVMEALIRKYFELRGDILAYAVAHYDTNTPHWHVLESGTYYRENKATGLRKVELQGLKLELEDFVKEHYPELEHSLVVHGKGREYTTEPEYQLGKRGEQSEREKLKQLVQEAYHTASSKQQFLETLQEHGYLHYERNSDGQPTGLISESGRKFRFKTLGLDPEKIKALEKDHERTREQELLNQIQSIRLKNSKTLEK